MAFSTLALFSSCKKELDAKLKQSAGSQNGQVATDRANTNRPNPFSRFNIERALVALGRPISLDPGRLYNYYRFTPERVSGAIFEQLEADTNSKILDFPMANMALYPTDSTPVSQADIDATKDGNLYIVLKANSSIAKFFGPGNSLGASLLAELYLPEASDEALQTQALIQTGHTLDPNLPSTERWWRPCLLKRPFGRVTFNDQHSGTRAVPRIEVWALAFGIPVSTLTNINGFYMIPYPFSAGAPMGTKAENFRVNVKPLNTTGTWVGAAASLVSNFVLGATHSAGWYNACQMRDPINIHFGNHGQPQYWAQILSLIYKSDSCFGADNTPAAPPRLTVYAQWDADEGNASAPMLGYINDASLLMLWAGYIFNINVSISVPGLFQLMTRLMPDITLKYSPRKFGYEYSQDLSHTMFHELGHASLFRRVGPIFWTKTITRTVAYNGYGLQSGPDWGLVQANEAWAEFIGKEHHSRIHTFNPTTGNSAWAVSCTLNASNCEWQTYPNAKETAATFSETWINTGIFHDVMDRYNPSELNDNISGYSINNMYNCFDPSTTSLCSWRNRFLQNNPSIPLFQLDNLMINQNGWNGQGCK